MLFFDEICEIVTRAFDTVRLGPRARHGGAQEPHTHGWPMATAVGQPGSMRASAADLRSESLLLEEVRG